jgi:glutamine amidotransferase
VGGFSVDNTHPFRFRQWLFAHVGTITGFEEVRTKLHAALPDFLRRNMRGSSDSEVFFHLVLAHLHATNHLEAPLPPASIMLDALRSAARTIDGFVGETRERSTLNCILCNGRVMYALRRGGPFGYVERTGLVGETSDEKPRPGSPRLHYVMLVSGGHEVPNGYASLGDGQAALVSRDLSVELHTL